MNTRIPHRRGFTLVELLVAIAIIGLLIALILPAVQMAREAARRTQCRNNLKQLALALHRYHDAHQTFPLNYGNGPYTDQNTGASWLQQILPFVDQGNLHGKIRFGQPLSDPDNTAVALTAIPLFLCPSDAGNTGRMNFRSNVPGTLGVQNYKACAGSNWNWGLFSPVTSKSGRNANNPDGLDHCNGLVCRGGDNQPTTTRVADVRDGTSHTFAVGESVPEWCRHTWWYWFNAVAATCAIPLNYKPEPDLQVAMEGDWWHNYSFLSRHSGGAHFALVDGSVKFVSASIDRDTYRALATVDASEAVPEF
jgi:prepilin-type N-terminal cleavage/methylation domain-containing protein/prepilin-type processing-associated H-X9-DG protein